jgi:predicted RNA binding protein YcfA (HicA-like mRNA interferase family)
MTKLPVVSSDDTIRALKKAGFVYAPRRGKGSHVALHRRDHHGRHQLVIVPKRRELPRGTLKAILEQAGLTTEAFVALL